MAVDTAGKIDGLLFGAGFGNLDAISGLLDQQGFELESSFVGGTELPGSIEFGPVRGEGGAGGKGNQEQQGSHVGLRFSMQCIRGGPGGVYDEFFTAGRPVTVRL